MSPLLVLFRFHSAKPRVSTDHRWRFEMPGCRSSRLTAVERAGEAAGVGRLKLVRGSRGETAWQPAEDQQGRGNCLLL